MLFWSAARRFLFLLLMLAFGIGFIQSELLNRVGALEQQANAAVDSVFGTPGRIYTAVKERVGGWLTGWNIMRPLSSAAAEGQLRYEYCLADVAFLNGGEVSHCETQRPGSERKACFESAVQSLRMINGIADASQLDLERARVLTACSTAFRTNEGLSRLFKAGVHSLGELYGYCSAPGACKEPNLESDEYRQCLYERFTQAPPLRTLPALSGGLGLRSMYCNAVTDSKRWRQCAEVAMIQQTARGNLGLGLADNPGAAAIGACRLQRQ